MIKFTKHALEMLDQRNLDKEKVGECVTRPDITTKTSKNRTIFLKDFGKNYLKVVVVGEGRDLIVITNHWIDKRRVKK